LNKGTTHFSLLLGNGLGSFSAPVNINASYILKNIYSSDFNNDGKKDILVAYSNSNLLSIFKGGGNGTFTLISNFNPGYSTNEININDFNNDTKMDLAVVSSNSTISTINGAGNCTFTSQTTYSNVVDPYKLTSGDLNNDGKTDIAVRSNLGSSDFHILLSNSSNSFQPISTYTNANTYFNSFCFSFGYIFYVNIVDYDNDGKKDILVGKDNCSLLFVLKNCTEVSLKENIINNLSINLYPNPANELVNVKCETLNDNEIYKIEIYNSIGQIIKEEEVTFKNQTATINTKELANGVYVLTLLDGSTSLTTGTPPSSATRSDEIFVSKRFVVAR
jgi:hypothetical protein